MPFLTEEELIKAEVLAVSEDSPLHRALAKIVMECRRLGHELADPNYLYAGTRVSRLAIISKDEEIKRKNKELDELRKKETCRLECSHALAIAGKPYPKMCGRCGLGQCEVGIANETVQAFFTLALMDAGRCRELKKSTQGEWRCNRARGHCGDHVFEDKEKE